MLHALNILYSWSTILGGIGGLILQRFYCYVEAEYGNRHHPLPGGRRYYVRGLNLVMLSGLVATLTVGYVLVAATRAQYAADTTRDQLKSCQAEFQGALTLRADITSEDADLANQISDLRIRQDDALAQLMDRILNPPPEIAALDVNHPRRLAWKADAQYAWTEWTSKLRAQIADLTNQRRALAVQRQQHPLPTIKC